MGTLSARALRAAGLGRCVGCDLSMFETVEEAARELGKDPAIVARALRRALREEGR